MIRRAMDAPPPNEAHARLAANADASFILESREGPKRMSRYSFVGANPAGVATLTNRLHVDGALPEPGPEETPLAYLRRVQASYHVDDHETPFIGGLVGSFGYDFVQELEPSLAASAPSASSWPKFQLGLYLDALVYDHHEETVHYVSRGEDRYDEWQALLAAPRPAEPLRVGPVSCPVSDDEFKARVEAAKGLIAEGENFQIVLSRPFHADYEGPLGALYDGIRRDHAVPYLFHVRFDRRELLGASPEMLVRVRNRRVETFPIAGTRPVTG
ncbi:MAG: chorismate-binding protein, partial [Thermoplasmatota archaeon]